MINSNLHEHIIDSGQDGTRNVVVDFLLPFECEKCGKRFKKKKQLKEHKADVHSY